MLQDDWKSIILTRKCKIIDAINVLNETGLLTIIVVDEEFKLLATITDGDIRKGLAKGFTIDQNISLIMNQHPKFVDQHETFKEIRAFEIPSATDYGHKSLTNSFNPNLYVDISETIEKKIKAIECYSNEIKDYPNSRSIQGITNIAKYRGNQVGLKCAEAFEIIRRIDR